MTVREENGKAEKRRRLPLIDIENMSSKTVLKEQYKSEDTLKLRKNLQYLINIPFVQR